MDPAVTAVNVHSSTAELRTPPSLGGSSDPGGAEDIVTGGDTLW